MQDPRGGLFFGATRGTMDAHGGVAATWKRLRMNEDTNPVRHDLRRPRTYEEE